MIKDQSTAEASKDLIPIERAMLDMIFPADCPCAAPLREQLRDCGVVQREFTSVGFFTDIIPNTSAPPILNTGRIWFGDV